MTTRRLSIASRPTPDGRAEFDYDALDRLTTETWTAANGTSIVNTMTREYDDASPLTGIDDASLRYAYTYDAFGRVLSVDNAGNPAGMPRTVLTNSMGMDTDTGRLAWSSLSSSS